MRPERNYSEVIFRKDENHSSLKQDGFFVSKVLTSEEVEEMLSYYQQFVTSISGNRRGHLTASCNIGNVDAIKLARTNIDKVFGKAMNRIFLPDAVEYTGGIFLIKSPTNNGEHKLLHQDAPLLDETKSYGIYTWTPLTPMDETTGKIYVVPRSNYIGSHQRSHLICEQLDEDKFREQFQVLNVQQGETLFFDARLMHGSLPNTSGKDRVAVNFFAKPKGQPCLYYARNKYDENYIDVFKVDPEFLYFNQLDPLSGADHESFVEYIRTERAISAQGENHVMDAKDKIRLYLKSSLGLGF